MVHLTHNIDAAISDLMAARAEIEKGLMPYVMQPGKYLEGLKEDARLVLETLCEQEERQYIDDIVNAVAGYVTGTGMAFEIVMTGDPMNVSRGQPGDLGWEKLKQFEGDIEAWVAEYKIKDASDQYKGGRGRDPGEPMSNTVIAQRIMAILNRDAKLFFSTGRSGHGIDDPEGLFQALMKNPAFSQALGLTSLPGDRLLALMTAVLDFWHDAMGVRLVHETMSFLNQTLNKPVPH